MLSHSTEIMLLPNLPVQPGIVDKGQTCSSGEYQKIPIAGIGSSNDFMSDIWNSRAMSDKVVIVVFLILVSTCKDTKNK
jgi:hypothetical protein